MNNAENIAAAKTAYKAALRALNDVLDEFEGGDVVSEAEAAMANARRAYKKALRTGFSNRTKLLRILVDELEDVIDAIDTSGIDRGLSEFEELTNELGGALEKAREAGAI